MWQGSKHRLLSYHFWFVFQIFLHCLQRTIATGNSEFQHCIKVTQIK